VAAIALGVAFGLAVGSPAAHAFAPTPQPEYPGPIYEVPPDPVAIGGFGSTPQVEGIDDDFLDDDFLDDDFLDDDFVDDHFVDGDPVEAGVDDWWDDLGIDPWSEATTASTDSEQPPADTALAHTGAVTDRLLTAAVGLAAGGGMLTIAGRRRSLGATGRS